MRQSEAFKFKEGAILRPKDAGVSDHRRDVTCGEIWTLYPSLDVPAYEVTWQCSNSDVFNELVYEDELEMFNRETDSG